MKDELKPIVEGLLKKSREGKVAWVLASTFGTRDPQGRIDLSYEEDEDFAVNTRSFTINVFRYSSIDDNNEPIYGVRINIINQQGNVIMSHLAFPEDDGYDELEELITLARKYITNEDTVIKKIMDGLNKPGVFGSTDTEPTT